MRVCALTHTLVILSLTGETETGGPNVRLIWATEWVQGYTANPVSNKQNNSKKGPGQADLRSKFQASLRLLCLKNKPARSGL